MRAPQDRRVRRPALRTGAVTLVDELLADLSRHGIRLRLDDAGQIRWRGPRDGWRARCRTFTQSEV